MSAATSHFHVFYKEIRVLNVFFSSNFHGY